MFGRRGGISSTLQNIGRLPAVRGHHNGDLELSKLPVLTAVALLLVGCATAEQGRVRLVAPLGVGTAYSEAGMRARLALSTRRQCADGACEPGEAARRRVTRLGGDLSLAAFDLYPELSQRISDFEFSVPARDQVGTLSTASGQIVVLEGLLDHIDDEATLSFVLAREMGHVIARHHEENTASSILVSVAVQLLLPVANLFRGAAAALPTSTAAMTTTVASVAGSRVLKAVNRPEQLDEADAVALGLLLQAGWDLNDVARAVDLAMPRLARAGDEGWVTEFRVSKMRLDQLDCGRAWPVGPEMMITALDAHLPLSD